jgi:SET domain-containing protein
MYIVPVEIKPSDIDGKGVFAKQDIKKGTVVWKYVKNYDKKISPQVFDKFDSSKKKLLERIAYLSPTSGMWVMPPPNDVACYTNHSPELYNTSTMVNLEISSEPMFYANRNIKTGEEITNNYLEFDKNTKPNSSDWLEPKP